MFRGQEKQKTEAKTKTRNRYIHQTLRLGSSISVSRQVRVEEIIAQTAHGGESDGRMDRPPWRIEREGGGEIKGSGCRSERTEREKKRQEKTADSW